MTVRWLRNSLVIVAVIVASLPVAVLAQSDKDQYEYIDISNPFLRKIPLAVPLFKNENGTGEANNTCNEDHKQIRSNLFLNTLCTQYKQERQNMNKLIFYPGFKALQSLRIQHFFQAMGSKCTKHHCKSTKTGRYE